MKFTTGHLVLGSFKPEKILWNSRIIKKSGNSEFSAKRMGPTSQSYASRRFPEDMDTEFSNEMIPTWCVKSLPKTLKQGVWSDPNTEFLKRKKRRLPRRVGHHFQFGEDPAEQESVVYMRLDRSTDVLRVLIPYYQSGNEIRISICLKYHGDEFFKRWIPFESIASLDIKFRLRCNQLNFTELLSNLSAKIQVFVAEEPEAFKPVLESEDIFYGCLNYTMASLSICQVTDVSREPKSVHYVHCYVFLDRSPSQCISGSKHSSELCTECTEASYLMALFNEIKHSSGTIDLCRPENTVRTMESDPLDTRKFKDDDEECMEPIDFRVQKATEAASTETVDTEPANPPSILESETVGSQTEVVKTSSDAGMQVSEESVRETTSKGGQMLRKVMTPKPIKRKHRGLPLEKFLMRKVERMRQRLSELQRELAENERSNSSSAGQSQSLTEAEVPSSFVPPSPPVTVVLFNNDGSTAVVPSMSPNSVENETSIALTSEADRNDAAKPFKCPMEGCNHRFNNKSSVSRHKKRVHFPHKLPKCHNCDHVFPRPYMLQRHLDHKVCFRKV